MIFSHTLTQYIKELGDPKYEPLTKEEEKELLIQFASGSSYARERLINCHLRFVIYLLRDYKIPPQVDVMDLIQEGNLGLIDGLQRFDPSYECRVFTYIRHYILWYIGRALAFYSKTSQFYTIPESFDFDNIKSEESEDITVKTKAYRDIVKSIEKVLTDKELSIIKLYFGLDPPYFKSYTLKEIGLLLHLDSEKVRQIKEQALIKIKKNCSFY
jgi:RNA polymerase sigma factor (sigma-70 family)